ncbi:6410_t:CDS:2 [Gigaspora rosea]|nr:6410_t:CDS:2 [Gigaspora rosea]
MAHINTNVHLNLKQKAFSSSSKTRQPILNSVVEASKSKKAAIKDLICGNIPLTNALCCNDLFGVFENYLITIKQKFNSKKVSLIVNETPDSRA